MLKKLFLDINDRIIFIALGFLTSTAIWLVVEVFEIQEDIKDLQFKVVILEDVKAYVNKGGF